MSMLLKFYTHSEGLTYLLLHCIFLRSLRFLVALEAPLLVTGQMVFQGNVQAEKFHLLLRCLDVSVVVCCVDIFLQIIRIKQIVKSSDSIKTRSLKIFPRQNTIFHKLHKVQKHKKKRSLSSLQYSIKIEQITYCHHRKFM